LPVQRVPGRNGRIESLKVDEAAALLISYWANPRLGNGSLTLCINTRADSTGPKGEKI
jgi:hypothetical protein